MSRPDPKSHPETIRLAHGVDAPRLGLGTFQLEGRACRAAVQRALALGYRHVDTAEGYGNEPEVGEAVRRSGVPREDVFLVSKVWRDHLRPDDLRAHLEETLLRLGTSYLDMYLVHWPRSDIPAEETAGGMERLRSEGLVRTWGVSNYTRSHLEEILAHGEVATNQVELHPYFPQLELAAFCRERGVAVTSYSPLARGRICDDPVIREVAEGLGRSPAQVVLRWALQRDLLVIPKATGQRHLRENFEVMDFQLGESEMESIGGRPRAARLFDFRWSEFDR